MRMTDSVTLSPAGHPLGQQTSGYKGVRVSKFRHVYGQSGRRESCYEGFRITTSAHDSQFCAVNPKFLAVVVDVAGGGAFQVVPLNWTGKVDYHDGRVSGHNGPVNDLKWNPFNDNVIASASDDGTVKLWNIPDKMTMKYDSEQDALCVLAQHSRRVTYVVWHPTAENVLASAGVDCMVYIWDVMFQTCLSSICHNDVVHSLSFNVSGDLIATTSKDKLLRIADPRTGEILKKGRCHEGGKASKVVFLGKTDQLVTTGFSRMSRRQMAIWSQNDLSQPLSMQEIDASSGLLFPFFDQDLNILYIAGKGDGNIRYYEVSQSAPYLHYLSEFQSRFPQRGFGVMPKRALDVSRCEIFRLYKVHNTQPLVEPLSFIVPRKSDLFQSDLYPPTAGPTPAQTADEWLCGGSQEPVMISMRQGQKLPATCKPVQLKKAVSDDGHIRPLVITSDRNNDMKFKFLSQITKPDYRQVEEREDREKILRERELQEKMNERLAKRQSSGTDSSLESPRHSAALSNEEIFGAPRSPPPVRSPGASSAPLFALPPTAPRHPSVGSTISNNHSPEKIRRISESPHRPPVMGRSGISPRASHLDRDVKSVTPDGRLSPPGVVPRGGSLRAAPAPRAAIDDLDLSPVSPPMSPSDSDVIRIHDVIARNGVASDARNGNDVSAAPPPTERLTEPPTSPKLSPRPARARPPPDSSRLPKPASLVRLGTAPERVPTALDRKLANGGGAEKKVTTKPGCIGPGPVIPIRREPTAHVKPFRISQTQPNTPRETPHHTNNSTTTVTAQSSSSSATTKENIDAMAGESNLYAAQCKRVRELLQTMDEKDARINQLENDVRQLTERLEKATREAHRRQEDIDSLRYEMKWKDDRIQFLEEVAKNAPSDQSVHSTESDSAPED